MVFDVNDKVAIVTGGASGIGLSCAKELLRNGAKGVTIADVNEKAAENALIEIEKEFGKRALFVYTDVTNLEKFEYAFIKTVETFGNIDIVINNAGLYADGLWETEIALHVNGVVHGILLGINKYLPKYHQGSEALIVNISSVNATERSSHLPVYCGTKLAILGFTRAWGVPDIFEKTKVRVIALCPGPTQTHASSEGNRATLGEMYSELRKKKIELFPDIVQQPEFFATEALRVIKHGPNGTIWVIEKKRPAYRYELPDRSTMVNNVLSESEL